MSGKHGWGFIGIQKPLDSESWLLDSRSWIQDSEEEDP